MSLRPFAYTAFAIVLLVVPPLVIAVATSPGRTATPASGRDALALRPLSGRVVTTAGRPIRDASVIVAGRTTRSTADGRFSVDVGAADRSYWVTASRRGFLSLTRAGQPGHRLVVRLSPDDGRTITLNFVGDVMFGRRFFDPNEDGSTSDGLLQPDAPAAALERLLAGVRPLLADADVTVVNLETPLIRDPYYDPTRSRPRRFHRSKEFAFASSPGAAAALAWAGVDVTGLGNNHLYDALDAGVRETTEGLAAAGFQRGDGQTGAGLTVANAWRPAVRQVRGQAVAIIACTTVTGPISGRHVRHDLTSYVAEPGKGGAARCTRERLRRAVTAARRAGQIPIVLVHGGFEYERQQSPTVKQMSRVARAAGAVLVMDGHPHVIQGFDWNGKSLIAWSLGNFLFDQVIWPTFEAYLVHVELSAGRVRRVVVEPLMIDGFLPHGLSGPLADSVVREAAGRSHAPFIDAGGALELLPGKRALTRRRRVSVKVGLYRVRGGTSIVRYPVGSVELGRDLLWIGSFEHGGVVGDVPPAPLWSIPAGDAAVTPAAARTGRVGVRLRPTASACPTIAPIHRILIDGGTPLTLTASLRGTPGALVGLQLSWYQGKKGASRSRTSRRVPLRTDRWTSVALDVTAPPWATAVSPYLALVPGRVAPASLDVDDVALIRWANGARPSPLYDYVRARRSAPITVVSTRLPDRASPLESDRARALSAARPAAARPVCG